MNPLSSYYYFTRMDVDFSLWELTLTKEAARRKRLKQMYIDVGQKTFNKSGQCSHCNFFYLIGDEEDEKEHAKYCAEMGQAVRCKFSKNNMPRKIHTFDKWATIVEFPPSDMKTDESLQKVAAQMKDDIGFDVDTVDDENETLQLYIYLENGDILGVLLFERIVKHSAHAVFDRIAPAFTEVENLLHAQSTAIEPSLPSCSLSITPRAGFVDNVLQEDLPGEFNLGVRYIWVHKKWRRKGIASSLCDIARRNAEYGKVIKRSAVSFSQPTSCGVCFAVSYTKNASISSYI